MLQPYELPSQPKAEHADHGEKGSATQAAREASVSLLQCIHDDRFGQSGCKSLIGSLNNGEAAIHSDSSAGIKASGVDRLDLKPLDIDPKDALPNRGQIVSELIAQQKAHEAAKNLEKNPDVTHLGDVLKTMDDRDAEKMVDRINRDLEKDGSSLHLDLSSHIAGCFNSYKEVDLVLTDNGREISKADGVWNQSLGEPDINTAHKPTFDWLS